MARTPLMKFFIQMSEDHKRAEELGVPVEKILEERIANEHGNSGSDGISRRQFVGTVTAAAAAVMMPWPRYVFASPAPRIAIIGGGIAGLNAALTLQDAGVSATVYEASQRIGGRMFSNTGFWKDGQVSEWCGELIDTGHKTIIDLCKRFHLNLDDLKTSGSGQDTYYFFNQYYPVKQAYKDWQNGIWQAIQKDQHDASYPTTYNSFTAKGKMLDEMSVYDWIETRVPNGHNSPMGRMLDVAYNIEYGAETNDQSALNLVYLLGFNKQTGGTSTAGVNGSFQMFGSSNERYHIRGGNQQLPTAIAAALNNPVQTGKKLASIEKKTDGTYILKFNDTTTVIADLVILAIPFAVLRSLDYSKAGFDALKNTAIQELGRGKNGKLQLQFNSRYWNGTGAWLETSTGLSYTDVGYQTTWEASRAQSGASGILNNYTGGNVTAAMKTMVPFSVQTDSNVKKDADNFLVDLEKVLPGGKPIWNGMATSSLPHLDPNFSLAYSYYRKGQYTTFGGKEKERQGNVFFAGEHCSGNFQGFMEGGAEQGERAALEILDQLGMHASKNKKKDASARQPASAQKKPASVTK